MLVNSVVIVLREVLEAALMVSILLAASRYLELNARWVLAALGLGLLGAVAYGYLLNPISELFEGVGQEVFNATLQFAVFVTLAATVFLIARRFGISGGNERALPAMMTAGVALAVMREGSEVFIYVSGFLQMTGFLSSVGVGSLTGASIGISVGVLFYYLLLAMRPARAITISIILLALIASGMAAQATKLLIQADWISVSGPIWDTSAWIREDSLSGQLLYALIGYEATPSATEIAIYSASLVFMGAAFAGGRSINRIRSGRQ